MATGDVSAEASEETVPILSTSFSSLLTMIVSTNEHAYLIGEWLSWLLVLHLRNGMR